MRLFDKRTPLQKEWDKLEVQEQRFLQKRLEKKESILNQKLEEKEPELLKRRINGRSWSRTIRYDSIRRM